MALLVGASILVAAVVEMYSEDVREYSGPLGYAYQKTWTKVWYDDSARRVVDHTGGADIRSGGMYFSVIRDQEHPAVCGCVYDRWSGYKWIRIDYDSVDWHAPGGRAWSWFTVSLVIIENC
jgi:hypothetical protein